MKKRSKKIEVESGKGRPIAKDSHADKRSPKKVVILNFLPGERPALSPQDEARVRAILHRDRELEIILNKTISDARDSREHLALLVKVAMDSAAALKYIADEKPEWVKDISRKLLYWPVLAAPHPKTLAEIKAFIKSLSLGEVSSVEYKNVRKKDTVERAWSIRAIELIDHLREWQNPTGLGTTKDLVDYMVLDPAVTNDRYAKALERQKRSGKTRLDILLEEKGALLAKSDSERERYLGDQVRFYQRVDDLCRNLPPLTSKTADKWWAVIWECILYWTKGAPEENEELRPRGLYRQGKTYTHAGDGSSTEKANIRNGISDRMYNAYKTLVKKR